MCIVYTVSLHGQFLYNCTVHFAPSARWYDYIQCSETEEVDEAGRSTVVYIIII